MYPLLMDTVEKSHGTPVDHLIVEFSMLNGMSYLYVTHDVQSGFVTYKKEKRDEPIVEDEESKYMAFYTEEISTWRRNIKLRDDQTILIACEWYSDEDICLARMVSE